MKIYVQKVIQYESGQMDKSGLGRYAFLIDNKYGGSLLISSAVETEISSIASSDQRDHIALNCDVADTLPSPWIKGDAGSIVNATANAWWISYIGHACNHGWSGAGFDTDKVKKLLHNEAQFPVVFSIGCDSGQFSPNVPFGKYKDLGGTLHDFAVPPPANARSVKDMESGEASALPFVVPVPQPYDLSNAKDRSFASSWLFQVSRGGGAIAYFGETVTMPDDCGRDLQQRVLRRYRLGDRILGDMWLNGQQQYWSDFAGCGDVFREPRIFLGIMTFFGDPSLRLR